jgi:acetyl-CoA carboxylase biotin carboxyl carrier protein
MNPEELAELKELIEFLKENKVGEFDLERGDLKVRLKFAGAAGAAPAGASLDMAQLAQLLGGAQAMHAAAASSAPAAAGSSTPTLAPASATGLTSGAASEAAAVADEEAGLHIVRSPIVGTFYESSSPGSMAFVKPGDQVETGQVLCIIEAMKLMNEIESDAAGEIVKRFVVNGQPVEYGQQLFSVRPR